MSVEDARTTAAQLDRVVSDDPTVDRTAVFARLRAEAPVFYSSTLNAWVVTRHEDVRGVLRDSQGFRAVADGPGAPPYGRTFLHMEGREHAQKVYLASDESKFVTGSELVIDGGYTAR